MASVASARDFTPAEIDAAGGTLRLRVDADNESAVLVQTRVVTTTGDDTRCSGCGLGWWVAGNEMLLCDGPGCVAQWHMACCDPPLTEVHLALRALFADRDHSQKPCDHSRSPPVHLDR